MDLNSLAVYDDEELELTMDFIKKLSDRREQVRFQWLKMEQGTFFGQAPPTADFNMARASLIKLNVKLRSSIVEDLEEISWWRNLVKVIETFLQAQSAMPTCTLPMTLLTNMAKLPRWPCNESASVTNEPSGTLSHQSPVTSAREQSVDLVFE
ncbi:hypothetical protein TYRP_009937 [Tyrophagus putrescentiae]|nr:hypothetical protein TYRP_009937 [Tyrophagus putrescentiae]